MKHDQAQRHYRTSNTLQNTTDHEHFDVRRERTDHASDARYQEHAAQHFATAFQVGKTRKEQRKECCCREEHRLRVADLDRCGGKLVLHGYERWGEHRSIELECEDSHQQRCHYRDN